MLSPLPPLHQHFDPLGCYCNNRDHHQHHLPSYDTSTLSICSLHSCKRCHLFCHHVCTAVSLALFPPPFHRQFHFDIANFVTIVPLPLPPIPATPYFCHCLLFFQHHSTLGSHISLPYCLHYTCYLRHSLQKLKLYELHTKQYILSQNHNFIQFHEIKFELQKVEKKKKKKKRKRKKRSEVLRFLILELVSLAQGLHKLKIASLC